MKIGLVTGEYPPMEGGVGAFTEEIAKSLNDLDNEIHIITDKQARPSNYPRTLSRIHEPIELPFAKLHAQINAWGWSSLSKIVDIVLRYELDVVNIQYQAAAYNMNSPAINFLPWRLKGIVKTIITYHDLRVPYLFPKAGTLRKKAVLFMAAQGAGVIVTNKADYESIIASTSTPAVQIPIGSNIDIYNPNHIEIAEVHELLGVGEGDILLGYFGFLNESKGADILINTLAELDDRYSLVFIGGKTGSSDSQNTLYTEKVMGQIEAMGLTNRIHWTGFVSDTRVSTFLHAADLMVMPYRDGLSLRRGTLMAALAHGRPLITTNPKVSIPELSHGNNIWLVPSNDSKALVKAIETLSVDPELRQKIGLAAAEIANNYSWDKIAGRTLSFYKELIEKRDQS